MTNTSKLAVTAIALALLSACSSTTVQAPVIDRAPAPAVVKAAPVEEPARDEHGMYTVKKGDTLIRIALEYGQNYRDLVTWNNLANPNDIKVDQVLRVLPPEAGASSGVQTSAVAMPQAENHVPPPAPAVPRKNGPKGEKRPYSDSALAELQKPEGAAVKPEKGDKPEVPVAPPAAVATIAPALPAPAAEEEKLSWIWPADGKVVASFDEGKNKGIDIAGKAGQQVLAASAGKVMYAGSGIRGYGNLVIVKHSNSLLSAYAHNRTILVKEGQSVSKGQMIAEMGDSDTDSVKLHFEIRQQGKPVDPSKFLPNR